MAKHKWFQSSKMELKVSFDVLCDAAEDQCDVAMGTYIYISLSSIHSLDSCNHIHDSVVEDCGGEQKAGAGEKDLWQKLEAETCPSGE